MINFTKRQNNLFVEGITHKGNQIYFAEISENKIIVDRSNTEQLNNSVEPTRIIIYSNITITDFMREELEKSGILKIISLCNMNQQIIAYPRIGFSYDKLKVTLSDFIDKFDL